MRLFICHDTIYHYQNPAYSIIQTLRLTPRDHDGQHVLNWRIEPSIDGHLRGREDSLGNIVHMFSSEGRVPDMTMRIIGEVETFDTGGLVRGAVERLPDLFYLRETGLTQSDATMRAFAQNIADRHSNDPLGVLHDLMQMLHKTVMFDTEPTHVATTAAEAFALGRGVCQDITHIFVSCARHLNIPARYVSGYFFRADGVTDQEAGHAWAEAKVPELGWVGFDPTNGISITDAHIRVAIGLDYLSAAPVRGSRFGGGTEKLDVRLKVEAGRQAGQ
jgi:transglutaminase-like putative cysteine protease